MAPFTGDENTSEVMLIFREAKSSNVRFGLGVVEVSEVRLGLGVMATLDTSVDSLSLLSELSVNMEQRLFDSSSVRAGLDFFSYTRFRKRRQHMTSKVATRNLWPLMKYMRKLMELLVYTRRLTTAKKSTILAV